MKAIGYYLFALIYYLCSPFPVIKKRVFCIMTHDDGEGSNVSITVKKLKAGEEGYTFRYLTKRETQPVKSIKGLISMLRFFLVKPYELARAEIVLLDNVFLPYAYLRGRKGVKTIQLWHGTGSIKKFGQDVNRGKLWELEKRANSNITHLIVNSESQAEQYSGAFGVDKSIVYPIGLPRTDELFNRMKQLEQTGCNKDKEFIYSKYRIPSDCKLILYAPTFRDDEIDNRKTLKLIHELAADMPGGYYLGLRLHPFIAQTYKSDQLDQRICQFSFEKDLNALLMASDILITDYSSIVFEYCITKRPIIFYAYDLKEFSDKGRGFYCDYLNYVPGPVAYDSKAVINLLKEQGSRVYDMDAFISENYDYTDGNAVNRLIRLLQD